MLYAFFGLPVLQPADGSSATLVAAGKGDFGVSYQEDVTYALTGGGVPEFEVVDAGVREYEAHDLDAGVADATFGSYWGWELLSKSIYQVQCIFI